MAAKEAAKLPEQESVIPVPYGVARAVAKAYIKDKDPEHHVVSEAYKGYVRKTADKEISSRKEGAMLAQLRSGHCLELVHYKNRIDPTKSATCPRCEEDDETVKHWISCPATVRTRERIFGKSDLGLDVLAKHPKEALAYAEETLQRKTSDA